MRVAVVGGGHAGLLASIALARSGYNVTLYEEHRRVGRPPHCTGIVSHRYVSILRRVGVNPERVGLRAYRGVKILVNGREVAVLKAQIYRINRVALEEELLRIAEKEGVEAVLRAQVKSVKPNGSIKVNNTSLSFEGIIVAEGWRARLLREAGLPVSTPLLVYGVNYLSGKIIGNKDYIIVETLDPRAECFFSWRIPLGNHVLEGYGSKMKPLNIPGDAKGIHGGVIILGPPKPIISNKLVSFGDASRLVKPLTGGGLASQAETINRYIEYLHAGSDDPIKALYYEQRRIASRLAASYPLASYMYGECAIKEIAKLLRRQSSVFNINFEFDYHISFKNIINI